MAKQKIGKEQSLESILMNCRNALRETVGGNEKNRDAVMGLLFLKFAGDMFEKRRTEIVAEHGNNPVFLEKVMNERLKSQIKNICPTFIKRAMEEVR